MLLLFANLLTFYLCLIVLTPLHELGHALMGKAVGFRILSVKIGYGRALWESVFDDTKIRVGRYPFGGSTTAFPTDAEADYIKTRLWCFAGGGILVHLIFLLAIAVYWNGEVVQNLFTLSLFIEYSPSALMFYANGAMVLFNLIPINSNNTNLLAKTDGFLLATIPFEETEAVRDALRKLPEAILMGELIENREWKKVAELCESLLEKDGNPVFLINLGVARLELGEVEEALDIFRRALPVFEFPGVPNAKACLAILKNNIAWANTVLDNKEKHEESLAFAVEAHESAPKLAVFKGTLGSVLISEGNYRAGREHLMSAFRTTDSEYHKSACACFLAKGAAISGKHSETTKWLEIAKDHDPEYYLIALIEKQIEQIVSSPSFDADPSKVC